LVQTVAEAPAPGWSGTVASPDSSFGVRFAVTETVTTSSVGGLFYEFAPGGGFYGAVVRLTGPADFPDSTDLSTADVVGAALLNAPVSPNVPEIVSSDLSLTLTPGDYALVFGSGAFGATGTVVNAYPGVSTPSGFLYGISQHSGSGAWTNTDLVTGLFFLIANQVLNTISIDDFDDPEPLDVIQPDEAGGLVVDIPLVANGGELTASFEQLPVAELLSSGSEARNIEFTGTLLGTSKLTFRYDESLLGGAEESQLAIYHYSDGEWIRQVGIVNTEDNTITVSGVSHFSDWGLGLNAAVPEPSTWVMFSMGSLCLAWARRRRGKTASGAR
jgi:hypothetical protein